MGLFSQEMRQLVVDLTKELGNPCTLTKVVTGVYDPLTGETPPASTQMIPTFSAPSSDMSIAFSRDGENTNLGGFSNNNVMIPYFDNVDTGWLFDGQNILTLEPIKTQGEIVAYEISVGVKE
jgi:hypothetical protein